MDYRISPEAAFTSISKLLLTTSSSHPHVSKALSSSQDSESSQPSAPEANSAIAIERLAQIETFHTQDILMMLKHVF